ncbi:MAG: modification methylase (endogenous virus) [Lactobacillus phage ViSo-2018a]|uniref:Modification methylase n=1 Tax=Lactobacillus phage ViSo-2018a TaxID=2267607 RepID=A0A3G6JGV5_9CAUD|nr:MAG: modification methylase [Lactobacillus phage ViSo-2018a]AZA17305.1 MAG: modification methylase [Lactobacillus phage ViSo-2018a]
MEHNLKFNKKLKKKLEKHYGKLEYPHYENYDAIEVPFVESIPSDYDGMMGVPITFMDKYNPEQFEIVDSLNNPVINKKTIYKRIVIRLKHGNK